MNLILIRHSKSLVNPNIPIPTWGLSEEGVILAKKLNGIAQIETLDVIYSSLQPKALETAILATKNTGIKIKTDNKLTESTSFTNKFITPEHLELNSKRYYSDNKSTFSNGESFEESLSRFAAVVDDIIKIEAGKRNIGIVSHGNVLTAFASQFIKKDAYEIHEDMKYPDIAVLDWDSKKFTSFFGEIPIG